MIKGIPNMVKGRGSHLRLKREEWCRLGYTTKPNKTENSLPVRPTPFHKEKNFYKKVKRVVTKHKKSMFRI